MDETGTSRKILLQYTNVEQFTKYQGILKDKNDWRKII